MAKISFGQITLEDPNMNIDQLIEKYKALFEDEEFKYPLISTFAEELDELDVLPEDEEDIVEAPAVGQPN